MTNNPIYQFLQEIVVRLGKKSPKFFKILQQISIAVALIPGIPVFLTSIGVTLPLFLVAISSKTIAIAGLVAAFLTGLPVDKDIDKISEENKVDTLAAGTVTVIEKDISLPFSDNNK